MFAQTLQSFPTKKAIQKIITHPESWLLAVEGPAVLVPVLVGLVLGPGLEVPGGARHPDPAPLMVHVSGPHPPGVLLVTADGCGKINSFCFLVSNALIY